MFRLIFWTDFFSYTHHTLLVIAHWSIAYLVLSMHRSRIVILSIFICYLSCIFLVLSGTSVFEELTFSTNQIWNIYWIKKKIQFRFYRHKDRAAIPERWWLQSMPWSDQRWVTLPGTNTWVKWSRQQPSLPGPKVRAWVATTREVGYLVYNPQYLDKNLYHY